MIASRAAKIIKMAHADLFGQAKKKEPGNRDTPLHYTIRTNQSPSFFAGFDSITTCGTRYTAQQKRRRFALENITHLHHPPTSLSLISGQPHRTIQYATLRTNSATDIYRIIDDESLYDVSVE